ncbi:MAG TPA: Spy/CpxP family protein refolding chaperone [Burkholderiales bacterium]|nr:Spy/CpxP family protein refolding chaperone [Burkholderiales bacterium]
MNRSIGASLFSAALAFSAGSAVAQSQHEYQQRPFSQPTEQVEARLAYIRTALRITDAEQPQWNAFADSMRQQAAAREKKMHEWHEKMMQKHKEMAQNKGKHEHRQLSVIERMERGQKMHADAIAQIDDQLATVKPLYESLSAEQKKVADVVLAPKNIRERGFGHGHGGGRDRSWGRA